MVPVNRQLKLARRPEGRVSIDDFTRADYREAFAAISRDPGWWLGLLVRKAFYTWAPVGPSYTLHSRRYYIASIMSYGLLLAAGLAGAAVVIARRRWPTAL